MNQLFAAALAVQQFCTARGWRCCYIGGLAVQRWGEQRQTSDGDLTPFTGFARDEEYVDAILQKYSSRRPDAREFALQRRRSSQFRSYLPTGSGISGKPNGRLRK